MNCPMSFRIRPDFCRPFPLTSTLPVVYETRKDTRKNNIAVRGKRHESRAIAYLR